VILPYPLMLPEAAAAPLKSYVEYGGALVAEARLGWSNERGYASERIPGMGLWELMGCRETAVQVASRGRTSMRFNAGAIPGLKPDENLPGRWYEETLEPAANQARAAAQFGDGSTAAVLSQHGRGKTLMLGSFVSAAYENSPSRATEHFYAGLLEWAGVVLPVQSSGDHIEVRTLESAADTLVFVFNHAHQAADANVSLRIAPGEYRAGDLVNGQSVSLTREGAALRFNKRLAPDGVWVLRLSRPR